MAVPVLSNHLLRMASVAGENFASHGEVSVVAYCLASCHFVGELVVSCKNEGFRDRNLEQRYE